jgi:hypothetical protein
MCTDINVETLKKGIVESINYVISNVLESIFRIQLGMEPSEIGPVAKVNYLLEPRFVIVCPNLAFQFVCYLSGFKL